LEGLVDLEVDRSFLSPVDTFGHLVSFVTLVDSTGGTGTGLSDTVSGGDLLTLSGVEDKGQLKMSMADIPLEWELYDCMLTKLTLFTRSSAKPKSSSNCKKYVYKLLNFEKQNYKTNLCYPWPDFEGRCGEMRTSPEIVLHLH
jgi:hypothetical protein